MFSIFNDLVIVLWMISIGIAFSKLAVKAQSVVPGWQAAEFAFTSLFEDLKKTASGRKNTHRKRRSG